jgi:hypothetical protein
MFNFRFHSFHFLNLLSPYLQITKAFASEEHLKNIEILLEAT